jgi:hypothetical protein
MRSAFIVVPAGSLLLLALYGFVLVTAIALIVSRFWSEKLNKVVHWGGRPVPYGIGIRKEPLGLLAFGRGDAMAGSDLAGFFDFILMERKSA